MATARTVFQWIVTAALFVVAPAVASSQSITFTQTGVSASGSVGSTTFSSRDFTITSTGDVASRQSAGGAFFMDNLSSSISIVGVGTYNFITGTRTFVNNSLEIVGFSRAGESGDDLYDGPVNTAFATWDMTTSIGVFTGDAQLLQWALTPVIQTDGGTLAFDNAPTTGTFSAVVGPTSTSTVPEPSTYALMASGLLALTVVARRRGKV